MTSPTQADAVTTLLRDALADPGTAWSLGSFGAIAEFMRDPDEATSPLPDGRMGLATERGAIALAPSPDLRPVAYETAVATGWNHAVALCLPEDACAMSGRTVITELGPDHEALRAEDRAGILFDLGLGLLAVDACVRTSDPDTIACLRSGLGRPLFELGNPVGPRLVTLSPHRVFLTRIGRVEVFSAIPGPSAVTTALAVSGLPTDRFCFEGFPPRKGGERARRFAELAADARTHVLFESPRRIAATLTELRESHGDDRAAVVCRELTKTHEEIVRGSLAELAAWAAGQEASGGVRGEITLVVAGVGQAASMQVFQETGLVNRHQWAQAHRHRGELPEIRH